MFNVWKRSVGYVERTTCFDIKDCVFCPQNCLYSEWEVTVMYYERMWQSAYLTTCLLKFRYQIHVNDQIYAQAALLWGSPWHPFSCYKMVVFTKSKAILHIFYDLLIYVYSKKFFTSIDCTVVNYWILKRKGCERKQSWHILRVVTQYYRGPQYLSRYSGSLRAGRSGGWNPAGGGFSARPASYTMGTWSFSRG